MALAGQLDRLAERVQLARLLPQAKLVDDLPGILDSRRRIHAGADTEVLISIREFKETGDLIKYGELIDPYEPEGKKTQKVKTGGKD